MPEPTAKEQEDLMQETARRLAEHFDAVQILASVETSAGTRYISRGCGNWFARQGMAREFIANEESQNRADALAPKINPPEDESWRGVDEK